MEWRRHHHPARGSYAIELVHLDPNEPGLPEAIRRAWELRREADKLDGYTSYAVRAALPVWLTPTQWWDTLQYGVAAMQTYGTPFHYYCKVIDKTSSLSILTL